jgi:hypothetical protein
MAAGISESIAEVIDADPEEEKRTSGNIGR